MAIGVLYLVIYTLTRKWGGDNSEYWISDDLGVYLSVVVIGIGLTWSIVVLAVQEAKERRRSRRERG